MSDTPESRGAFFDALYDKAIDPWHFHDRTYEIAKRAQTLRALPRQSYAHGCEIGCSIGVLTADLAPRVQNLLGIDIAEAAAARARVDLAAFPHVRIEVMHVPATLPTGVFDLLVLSEILYFLTATEIEELAGFAARQLAPGGDVIIVNFDGETLTTLNGREATEIFTAAAASHFDIIDQGMHPQYHIYILRRRDG